MSDNKVETELLSQIKKVLLKFPKYWEKDVLLRNRVAEDLREYNQELIEALLSNQLVKDTYSITLNSTNIFKIEEFISMLRYKNYWENSYTKYSNEIGLTSEGKYLNYNTDVVLDFPHKDSILEGGMTKEDQGKEEVYYHNVLAKEEIDTLLSPKVLTNIKKYDKNGEHDIDDFTDKDNLIIKGNNLIVLNALKEIYEGKVKVIYIDPPFNTGNDSFKYNDKFTRSTWLTFMKNRLEIARELLTSNGNIFIHIDNNQSYYLKVLLDSIFGEENFVEEYVWAYGSASGGRSAGTKPVNIHDHIFHYAKNYSQRKANKIYTPYSKKYIEDWFKYDDGDGRIYRRRHRGVDEKGEAIWEKQYLDESKGVPLTSVWSDIKQIYANPQAYKKSNISRSEIELDFGNSGQKPEELIRRIIDMSTDEGDIILDFFIGSGTTPSTALKTNRQFIGIEQIDSQIEISKNRLIDSINGKKSGISKDVDWKGGGSFVYAELASLNEGYVKNIQQASNERELEKVLSTMKESAYLNFKVDLERVSSKDEGYRLLSLEEKKEVLIQVLDMNQLYLSYSEIEDEQYKIPEDVKAFNHSFYQKEGVKDE
ncbi:site-specific DNA-methyltransferase [Tetragenococcus halophilus]|uniref:Site-specific DNA-methyltransferase n=1 Tax=Tetragenococcus halophilus TaxID=51669 RepID=A0AB35HSE8_TETHA|nr:site-specific DNA-methyltransferase [Tetragenococcus halophilus]MCO8296794.1 site-specific DNA-methyltransferase [Tetragenococcus halophilus]MCO8299181.1 site-specific DNA-methyltransferase [Tetragenococcus halophilus]